MHTQQSAFPFHPLSEASSHPLLRTDLGGLALILASTSAAHTKARQVHTMPNAIFRKGVALKRRVLFRVGYTN